MAKRTPIILTLVFAAAVCAAEPPSQNHWAYLPTTRPSLPPNNEAAGARNAIDRFVLARLQNEGLSPSPEAHKSLLIRRLSFDLTGLPPSISDVDQFLADPRPDAYERLVGRLLASPQFGERWARHWLDLARYADSHGFQRDDLRDIWHYRDWVVQAFNSNLPFDQFTIDQLAGDLLPRPTEPQRIATGFHRCCTTNVEPGTDPEDSRVGQVIDRVNTTATVWLGTTLECAQCHNHKYDPFSQRDYYRMFAFFNSSVREAERSIPSLAGSIKFMGPKYAIGNTATQVMQELPKPRVTQIFHRGDIHQPGEEVQQGTPASLHKMPNGAPDRLALARWLVARENPLVARVVVNRIWAELFGQGLVGTPEDFGTRGERPTHPELLDWLAVEFMDSGWSIKHLLRLLVTSATYRQSSKITSELLARDPSDKLLARGPRFRLAAEEIRDNALAIAGTLNLKMGGPPARPPQPEGLWAKVSGEKTEYVPIAGLDQFRRGIYVVWKRSSPYPSMANFDATARLTCTVKRLRSNTPLQALTLLNDPVYVEAARALARRIERECPAATLDEQLRFGFRLCLSREPRREEVEILRTLFTHQRASGTAASAWDALATTLLNLDETITKP